MADKDDLNPQDPNFSNKRDKSADSESTPSSDSFSLTPNNNDQYNPSNQGDKSFKQAVTDYFGLLRRNTLGITVFPSQMRRAVTNIAEKLIGPVADFLKSPAGTGMAISELSGFDNVYVGPQVHEAEETNKELPPKPEETSQNLGTSSQSETNLNNKRVLNKIKAQKGVYLSRIDKRRRFLENRRSALTEIVERREKRLSDRIVTFNQSIGNEKNLNSLVHNYSGPNLEEYSELVEEQAKLEFFRMVLLDDRYYKDLRNDIENARSLEQLDALKTKYEEYIKQRDLKPESDVDSAEGEKTDVELDEAQRKDTENEKQIDEALEGLSNQAESSIDPLSNISLRPKPGKLDSTSGIDLLDGEDPSSIRRLLTPEEYKRVDDEFEKSRENPKSGEVFDKDAWKAVQELGEKFSAPVPFKQRKNHALTRDQKGTYKSRDLKTGNTEWHHNARFDADFKELRNAQGEQDVLGSWIVKIRDGKEEKLFRVVTRPGTRPYYYRDENNDIHFRSVSKQTNEKAKDFGQTYPAFYTPYDSTDTTYGGAVFAEEDPGQAYWGAGADSFVVDGVIPTEVDLSLSSANKSNTEPEAETKQQEPSVPSQFEPNDQDFDFEEGTSTSSESNVVDLSGEKDKKNNSTAQQSIASSEGYGEYAHGMDALVSLLPEAEREKYRRTTTLRDTALPHKPAGVPLVQPRIRQWWRKKVKGDETIYFESSIKSSPIPVDLTPVNVLLRGGEIWFSDDRFGANAPYGESGDPGSPARDDRFERQRYLTEMYEEDIVRQRGLVSLPYIIETAARHGKFINRAYANEYYTKLVGDLTKNPEQANKVRLNTAVARLIDSISKPEEVLFSEARTSTAELLPKVQTASSIFLGGIDSLAQSTLGVNLGLSKLVPKTLSPDTYKSRKASFLEIHNPKSKYNRDLHNLRERIKENEALLNAIEEDSPERKYVQSLIDSYGRILNFAEKGYVPGTSLFAHVDNKRREATKHIEAITQYMIDPETGSIAGPKLNEEKQISAETASYIDKSQEQVDKKLVLDSEKAKQASKALAVLGKRALGLAIAFTAIKSTVKYFTKLNEEVVKVINQFATFNGLTAATARWFSGKEFERNLKEANVLSESRTSLAVAWSDLKDVWQPVILGFKDVVNKSLVLLDKAGILLGQGVNLLPNATANSFIKKAQAYAEKHPDFQKKLIDNNITGLELYEYYGGSFWKSSLNPFHTVSGVLEDYNSDPDFVSKILAARRRGGLDSPLTTKKDFLTNSDGELNRTIADRLAKTDTEEGKFFREHNVSDGDIRSYITLLKSKGVDFGDGWFTRETTAAAKYLSQHPDDLWELPYYSKANVQNRYEQLNRRALWRGYVANRAQEDALGVHLADTAELGQFAKKFGFTATAEEIETLRRDLKSKDKNTQLALEDEQMNYLIYSKGFGNFSTQIHGMKEPTEISDFRKAHETLQSIYLTLMRQLEATNSIDKVAAGILDSTQQVAQNTESDTLSRKNDYGNAIEAFAQGFKDVINQKGTKEAQGAAPWGWNPEKSRHGRWAERPQGWDWKQR